ncbi:MAG: hypothetical protein F8N37_01155 [Telmatospirillum sp.]|nr:hypothetical protein [Telmatospirillum sp.]
MRYNFCTMSAHLTPPCVGVSSGGAMPSGMVPIRPGNKKNAVPTPGTGTGRTQRPPTVPLDTLGRRHSTVMTIEKLTEREIEVLRWTASGKTSGEISDILSISVNTVNFHLKNTITKLRTANKTAAVFEAARAGILS